MRFFRRSSEAWEGDYPLTRARVYVLPTKAGLIFGAALLAMLLTTINYALSLGYVLIFLLASVALVSLFHTHRNLAGLVLRPGRAEPVHAGEIAELKLTLLNPAAYTRYSIGIDNDDDHAINLFDISAGAEQIASVAVGTEHRGWMAAPRFRIASDFPLGLWQAWTWWHPATGVLVYPRPEDPPSPLPHHHDPSGHVEMHQQGSGDFSHVRSYRAGDSMRRLAWKAMARNPRALPLTLEFNDGGNGGELLFEWQQLPDQLDTEQRLSRLAAWIEQAEAAGLPYALVMPGRRFDTAHGPKQRRACMEALARYDGGTTA
ncbi:MAG: DUF58 domain-containing protein [Lautropia sp.]|nr:DUF58 domain-containing protein [Lautropia sp.]